MDKRTILYTLAILGLLAVSVGGAYFLDGSDGTDTITVSFEGCEPYATLSTSDSTHTYTKGQSYGWLPTPTVVIDGWQFAGWYRNQGQDADPTTWGTQVTTSTTVIAGQYILWAHFTKVTPSAVFTVMFNYNGGFGEVGFKTINATGTTQGGQPMALMGTLPTAYKSGCRFDGWFTQASGGNQVFYDTAVNSAVTIVWAHFTTGGYTVTLNANNGTVSPSTLTVYNGDTFASLPTPTRDGYTFSKWTIGNNGATVTQETTVWLDGNVTLYAQWIENVPDTVYWSNSTASQTMYNGAVEIGFKWANETGTKTHRMGIELYRPVISDNGTVTWLTTNDWVYIQVSYPSATVTVTTAIQGPPILGTILKTYTFTSGMWSAFSVTIDTENGTVYFTPFYDFVSFSNYKQYDRQLVCNFSDDLCNLAFKGITHTESQTGTNKPIFSVLGTKVFLNTFGVVMVNPSINVYDYFPNITNARLNIPSVAIYGASMSVNGYTFVLDGSNVTIWTVKDSSGNNIIASSTTTGAVKKVLEFTNISITWQGGYCYLTFITDNITFYLGSYTSTQWTVSFSGIWYFDAELYEPVSVTEKQLSGDWETLPNLDGNTMLLLFIGVLMLLGIIARLKLSAKWLDLVVMAGAVVIAYMLLR